MVKIKTNKKSLIRWKIYIDRARMYIGYVQFLMIGFVFLKAYQDSSIGKLIFDNILISIPILFIIFIGFALVLGRIDTVLGLREEELRNSSSSNPVMREMLSNMEEMKKELKRLKSEPYNDGKQ
ncbi:hypothetical protein BTO06_11730 [Tenacibaculum sp. SZ-18]|uniref:hypothetical protein n=1 Tax=Tenacibaculum sp. SZ-18 TaxID=754423 RepID=UPI000CA252C6|nr:hypothetical protein [Tenacibaculum sp. SZ-18]AUC15777.1 hypothetical protein BTO06_11730 [Tenacibaculum sp. SZ-18]